MRVPPPDVSDTDVAECLASGWRVPVDEIAYAPVGFGSHHWRVRSGAQRLFVTVDVTRDRADLAASFAAAAQLHRHGLEFVHAPMPSANGSLLHTVADHHPLLVHRWLEGTVLSELDDDHTADTIGILARLHGVPAGTTPAHRTDLSVQGRTGFESAMRMLGRPWPGPYGERARTLLRRHLATLHDLFAIHDREAVEMRAVHEDWVVTHGEPHPDNLIVGAHGLHLIDWDTLRIAPAARDLVHVAGASGASAYREATGRDLPEMELDHYRREWDLTEICLYTADFAALHDETAVTAIMWSGYNESLDRLLDAFG